MTKGKQVVASLLFRLQAIAREHIWVVLILLSRLEVMVRRHIWGGVDSLLSWTEAIDNTSGVAPIESGMQVGSSVTF